MDKRRMAGDAIASFEKDGSLTPLAIDVLDTVGAVSGKTSTVHLTPKETWGGGLGGYVDHTTPEKIFLDPVNGNAHVLAHEAIHSQLGTDVGATQMRNRINYGGSNFNPNTDIDPGLVPREGGNRLRYVHEMVAAPTMLEEAAAQGGARGVMDKLGIKDADRGFRVSGSEGTIGDVVYRNLDGSVDQLAYPLMYRDQAVDDYTRRYGGTFEGKPLGIGIDPRFSDAEREVYYDIGDKSRARSQRMFNKYRNKFK